MSGLIDTYRHQAIYAVTGEHPAVLAKIADPAALDSLCRRLADADEARQILCANGHGWPNQSLADFVRAVLKAAKP
jgi:predicted amidohydrolase YtcJ